jgi:hypothetical protein
MPAMLAPYATPPKPVLAFLKTHSSLAVGGYGLKSTWELLPISSAPIRTR